jgi:hypothetical protein
VNLGWIRRIVYVHAPIELSRLPAGRVHVTNFIQPIDVSSYHQLSGGCRAMKSFTRKSRRVEISPKPRGAPSGGKPVRGQSPDWLAAAFFDDSPDPPRYTIIVQ